MSDQLEVTVTHTTHEGQQFRIRRVIDEDGYIINRIAIDVRNDHMVEAMGEWKLLMELPIASIDKFTDALEIVRKI